MAWTRRYNIRTDPLRLLHQFLTLIFIIIVYMTVFFFFAQSKYHGFLRQKQLEKFHIDLPSVSLSLFKLGLFTSGGVQNHASKETGKSNLYRNAGNFLASHANVLTGSSRNHSSPTNLANGQWLASSPERKWLLVEADVRGGGMIAWRTRKNVCVGG